MIAKTFGYTDTQERFFDKQKDISEMNLLDRINFKDWNTLQHSKCSMSTHVRHLMKLLNKYLNVLLWQQQQKIRFPRKA